MSSIPSDTVVYKIVTADLWSRAQQGHEVPPMPIDRTDGYIHLSSRAQLGETLRLHFAGQEGLFVLGVPVAAIAGDLRWEPSRGGALFPHLYGRLATRHVAQALPVSVDESGMCDLMELA